jgi:hypothetical protein
MSWFTKDIVDPIKNLIDKASASSDASLVAAAGAAAKVVAASIPSAVATPSIITGLETALNDIVDSVVEAAIGKIPVVGEALQSEGVQLANQGLDYIEQHTVSYVGALVSTVKSKLVALASAV